MITRQRTLALLLGVIMLSLMPLNFSADARNARSLAGPEPNALMLTPVAGGVAVPVTGTTSKGGKFTGTFNIKQFSVVNNQIVSIGTLAGTIQTSIGNVIGTVLKTNRLSATLPLAYGATLHFGLRPL